MNKTSPSIDSIINGFKKISTNEFPDYQTLGSCYNMECLLSEISRFSVNNGELECKKLSDNYTKLKMLKYLVQSCDILFIPFIKFMEKIDEINQYYLKNINLDPEYYSSETEISISVDRDSEHNVNVSVYDIQNLQNTVEIIKTDLEDSLNANDPIQKLELVLDAYSMMMLIVENINGKKYNSDIDSDFERPFKRSRCG